MTLRAQHDEDLRRKVEALLKAHDRLGNFLEEPTIAAPLAPLLRKTATPASPSPDAPRRGHRKTESSFQPRLRKRKGRSNEN